MTDWIVTGLFLAAALVASFTDLRSREVPDWLNYGLLFAAIGYRVILSAVSWSWNPLMDGALGFALFFGIACLMFYTGQWGGGDSKLLMAAGALLGLQLRWDSLALSFLTNVFVLGAVYAMLWAIGIAAMRKDKVLAAIKSSMRTSRMIFLRKSLLVIIAVLLASAFIINDPIIRIMLAILAMLIAFSFYAWIGIKAVEKCCMLKQLSPERLTEGDWIAKDVIIAGKRIAGPKDLGVSKKQISLLQKLKRQRKLNTVLVKQGVPFVPSFLLAYIAALAFGNVFLVFL